MLQRREDATNDTLEDATHKVMIPIDDESTEDATNPNPTKAETNPNTTNNVNIRIDTNIYDRSQDTTIDHRYYQHNGKATTHSIYTQDTPNEVKGDGNPNAWIPLILQQQRTNDKATSLIHTLMNTECRDIPMMLKDIHSNVLKHLLQL